MRRSHALPGAILLASAALFSPTRTTADEPAKVSYYKDIRPVFQQNCNGCHQPAKPQGGFVMTANADLLKHGLYTPPTPSAPARTAPPPEPGHAANPERRSCDR